VLAGIVLMLMQVISSSADTRPADKGPGALNHDSAVGLPPVDDGYASEVPREEIINRNQSALAADKGEQSIPVADEIEFIATVTFDPDKATTARLTQATTDAGFPSKLIAKP